MDEAIIGQEDLNRLSRLLNVDSGELLVEPLSGGLSNRSFRLSHAERQWVVRLPIVTESHRFQTLEAESEAALLTTVARAGLTPGVIACDSGSGALITEYLRNAAPWTPEKARLPENVKRIAATLRSLHGLMVSPDLLIPFRPARLAEKYLDTVRRLKRGEDRSIGVEEKRWAEELRGLASSYEARFAPTALCHHDLVATNILDDDQLWLVDFEYALWADPVLDLASLAAMNDYDGNQRSLLSQTYFNDEPIPFSDEQLDDVIRLERLLSYFWAVSRRGEAEEANDLRRFADSMAAMLR